MSAVSTAAAMLSMVLSRMSLMSIHTPHFFCCCSSSSSSSSSAALPLPLPPPPPPVTGTTGTALREV
jgi:hypothetical protein